ncbi:hypothetical protein V8E54_007954 [Elaphomyces granulatus]
MLKKDSQKLQVLLPFEQGLKETSAGLAVLRKKTEELQSKLQTESKKMAELQTNLQTERNLLQIERLRRLKLCIGNLLLDLAKLVFPETSTDPSTCRIQQLIANVTNKQLDSKGIPSKYWPFLRNLHKHIKERNSSAHDSAEDFALLLLSIQHSHPDKYQQWAPAFPVAYKATVEELAERALEEP